jgi:hypothetical protein
MFMFTVEPRKCLSITEGAEFLINLTKKILTIKMLDTLTPDGIQQIIFSVCYTCTIYSGYNDSRKP